MIRRFMVWLGYVPRWFTVEEFEQKVGRLPCAECMSEHHEGEVLIVCDRDLDAWFDAVLA